MDSGGGLCEYAFDPTAPDTWGHGDDGADCRLERELYSGRDYDSPPDESILDDDGVWRCPHPAAEGHDRCVFHRPPADAPPEFDPADALEDAIDRVASEHDGSGPVVAAFVGARFESLDLSDRTIGDHIDDLYLSYAAVDERVNCRGATVRCRLRCNGARFEGGISLSEATLADEVHFAGATLGGLLGKSATFERHAVFSDARMTGLVNCTGATFEHTATFAGIEAASQVRFTRAQFERGVGFDGATFEDVLLVNNVGIGVSRVVPGESTAHDTRYEHAGGLFLGELGLGFTDVTCNDRVTFEETDVTGVAVFIESVFERQERSRPITFEGVTFERPAVFGGGGVASMRDPASARFTSHVDFEGATFEGDTAFEGVTFEKGAAFPDTTAEASLSFAGATAEKLDLAGLRVMGTLELVEMMVDGRLDLQRCAVGERLDADDAVVEAGIALEDGAAGSVSAREATLPDSALRRVDLSGADFQGADLRRCDLESAFLSRAILSGADLRGARLYGAALGDVQIDDDTAFLGHPDGARERSPHTVAAIVDTYCCVYDPAYGEGALDDIDRAKSTYHALEELGGSAARPRLQARCFVRRQDLQKDEYRHDAAAATTWEERLIAGARYSRARAARATLLYGESPWRVIAWSLGLIVGFALLFPLGGWMKADGGARLAYSQIPVAPTTSPLEWLGGVAGVLGDSMYYSTLTFTALGFGDFQPVGLGRLLTTVETGSGAVLLALLVFILGRRAAR